MDFMSIPIVATAISLVIAWALFAILCSLVSEAIAQVKAERGRFMRKHLLKQLYDHPNGINWASMLYVHGTIDLLSRSSNKPTSDISPHLFAETLIEIVGKSQATQMRISDIDPEEWEAVKQKYNSSLLRNFKAATMVLLPSDVVSFLKQAMTTAEICGAESEAKVYDSLVLQIKAWYEQMTQRMSVWYGKKMRQRLFYLGAIIGLIINVDSIQLFQHFNNNPEARKTMMNYYEQHGQSLAAYADRLDSAQRAREFALDDTASAVDIRKTISDFKSDSSRLKIALDSLQKYQEAMAVLVKDANLPVGWDHSLLKPLFCKEDTATGKTKEVVMTGAGPQLTQKKDNLLLRIMGILITGFAASFGAPFWFQVLKKVYPKKTPTSQQAK